MHQGKSAKLAEFLVVIQFLLFLVFIRHGENLRSKLVVKDLNDLNFLLCDIELKFHLQTSSGDLCHFRPSRLILKKYCKCIVTAPVNHSMKMYFRDQVQVLILHIRMKRCVFYEYI